MQSATPFFKLATVSHNGGAHKTFACDEGPTPSGLGSAPTPLVYFSAALAFWSEWKALPPPPAWWGPITSFAFAEDRPGIVFTVTHEGVVAARHLDNSDWTPLAEFREATARLKQANDLSALLERVRRSP